MIRRILNRLFPPAPPAICPDIGAWARERNLSISEIHPPVLGDVEPFVTLDPIGSEGFSRLRAEFERPQELVCLEKSRVFGQDALVVLPDQSVCLQGNWDVKLLQSRHDYLQMRAYSHRSLKGDWFSLISHWSTRYYHWFSDMLVRLHTALPHLPPDTRFFIQPQPSDFHLQSLACYGIGPDRLLEQTYKMDSRPERLWFATPLGHTAGTSIEVMRAMGEKIRASLGIDRAGPGPGKRFWISRARAPVRCLLNEDELLPLLAAHDIQVCHLEDLDWREQVLLLRSAEWLLGPHGAGMTNLLFAPHCRLVGEVSHPSLGQTCYQIKALQLGMRYSSLEAASTPTEADPQAMRIDPAKVSDWLESLESDN